MAKSKASLEERPLQISWSRSQLGGERLEISGSEKWDGVVGSSQVLTNSRTCVSLFRNKLTHDYKLMLVIVSLQESPGL